MLSIITLLKTQSNDKKEIVPKSYLNGFSQGAQMCDG